MNGDRTAKLGLPRSILELPKTRTNQPCPRLVNGKALQPFGIRCFSHVRFFVWTTRLVLSALALSRTLVKAQCVLARLCEKEYLLVDQYYENPRSQVPIREHTVKVSPQKGSHCTAQAEPANIWIPPGWSLGTRSWSSTLISGS